MYAGVHLGAIWFLVCLYILNSTIHHLNSTRFIIVLQYYMVLIIYNIIILLPLKYNSELLAILGLLHVHISFRVKFVKFLQKKRELAYTKRTNTVQLPLYKVSRVVKFIETESRIVVTSGQEEEEMGVSVHWVQNFSLGR